MCLKIADYKLLLNFVFPAEYGSGYCFFLFLLIYYSHPACSREICPRKSDLVVFELLAVISFYCFVSD